MLSLILNINSCTLEHEVFDKINPDIFPQNEQDVEALLSASAYHVFSAWGIFGTGAGYMTQTEQVADVATSGWWDISWNLHEANSWFIDSDGRRMYDYSKYLASMTLNMERIKSTPITEEKLNRYTAELKCGLGFLSFLLYDMYGPIPIADLETLKDPMAEKILPRLSEEDMIAYIETNLIEAAAVLPYKYPDTDYGRFTKGLANTLLLKLYMMTENWDKAETIGRELIKPEYGYALVNDYHSLFTLSGEKNSEVIFSSITKAGSIMHSWHAHALTADYPATVPNMSKWQVFRMSWPFWESYDPNDIRREKMVGAYIGTGGQEHSRLLDRDSGVVGLLHNGAVPVKYGFEGTIGADCEVDIPIYRYADVLTLLAEAIVRNGNAVTGEAIDLVNQVRIKHGGLTGFTSFASVEDFLDAVLLERGHEFAFEGVRRQDIIRHGKFIPFAILKNQFEGKVTAGLSKQVDGRYKYERFPIPTKIITEGMGIILQNPGF